VSPSVRVNVNITAAIIATIIVVLLEVLMRSPLLLLPLINSYCCRILTNYFILTSLSPELLNTIGSSLCSKRPLSRLPVYILLSRTY